MRIDTQAHDIVPSQIPTQIDDRHAGQAAIDQQSDGRVGRHDGRAPTAQAAQIALVRLWPGRLRGHDVPGDGQHAPVDDDPQDEQCLPGVVGRWIKDQRDVTLPEAGQQRTEQHLPGGGNDHLTIGEPAAQTPFG